MNILLRDIPLFVEVARKKNFSHAADTLDMAVSTLSRRISLLEKEMGVPLFIRNTRNVELTPSGRVLLERSEYILAEADSACEAIIGNMKSPTGQVRVSVHADIYHDYSLAEALTSFAQRWPGMRLRISVTESHADLVTDPFDLDIQVGPLPDSGHRARKAYTIRPALYAAPAVLASHSMPAAPEDIRSMPCIHLAPRDTRWRFHSGGREISVDIHPTHVANSRRICYDLAMAGLGVTFLAPTLAAPRVADGSLIRLLPEWWAIPADIWLIMAGSQIPLRVRLLTEHLSAYFNSLE